VEAGDVRISTSMPADLAAGGRLALRPAHRSFARWDGGNVPSVRPEPSLLAWLDENLPGDVVEDDLERTYAFRHPMNCSRTLEKLEIERRGPDHCALWWIDFFDARREKVLETPLARKVFGSLRLVSEPRVVGAVAYNANFTLRENYRGQRFARVVYANEHDLYCRWGVREIHMTAVQDGRWVWMKYFGFLPREPELLAEKYKGWASRRHPTPGPPTSPSDYPSDFLSSLGSLMLYKVLSCPR
jgi:hypothetical protein